MFSSNQEPSKSKERITFPLNSETETFDRSFYHPSLTSNKLSTEEIDNTLSQMDNIYKKKEDHIFRVLFCSIFGLVVWNLPDKWHFEIEHPKKKQFHRGINVLTVTAAGLYIWNHNRKAKKQAGELLEQINQRTVPRGFRWYFPQNFEKIELYPDYTYDPNRVFPNDD